MIPALDHPAATPPTPTDYFVQYCGPAKKGRLKRAAGNGLLSKKVLGSLADVQRQSDGAPYLEVLSRRR